MYFDNISIEKDYEKDIRIRWENDEKVRRKRWEN